MDRLPRFWKRLLFFLHRARLEKELAEELETHRSLLESRLGNAGLDALQAREAARRAIGNLTQARESSRDNWSFSRLEDLLQDIRFALRSFVRNPGFTCTAVISLGLGIGINSAIFTAVDTILFKPLPVRDPHTLVTFSAARTRGGSTTSFPIAYADRLRASGAFADAITVDDDGLSFTYGERAERVVGEAVSPNFFDFLGVPPILGQGFTPDVRAGKWAPEVVLSYSFWKQRFAGDPSVVGRVIRLNTYPFTVVGVSPAFFLDLQQGLDPELRLPILPKGRAISQIHLIDPAQRFALMARLTTNGTRAQAEAIANAQMREFLRTDASSSIRRITDFRVRVLPGDRGWPALAEDYAAPLMVLSLLVAIALLIACANIANMLLARATARRKEFAVRNSMGAGRRRLIRQLLTESFVLSCLGGLFGLLIARWAARFLLHFLPQGHIPFVLDLRPDLRAILFTALLSILAALLFGTAPAVQSTRGDLGLDLKSDSSGSIGGKTTRLRNSLVVLQVAFSLALLILSGLFIQTVFNLRPHSEYAAADRILLFTMKPQEEIYTSDRIRAITADLIRRVSESPGVQAVALAENGPFASRSNHDVLQTPGHAPVEAASDSVTPGFFKTIGIPLRSGHDFRPTDKPGSPKVVIVNQTLARALFNSENPVGKMVELPSEHGSQFFEVVGVVGDTHYYDLHIARRPAAFFAFQNDPPYMPTLHVRVSASNPDAFIPAIRHEFDQVDKGFPVFNIRTLELRIQDALARECMIADLSAAFGLLALALAAVGLYGTLSYSVARRTREIGIRMALGSEGAAVIWMIGREALLLVAMGVGAGCAVAICGGYAFSRALYGVAPADPIILSAASTLMFVTASVAACIPATRAARVDPIVALHYE